MFYTVIAQRKLTLNFSKTLAFPGGSDGKEFACNAGDLGLTPGLGRSPGEGKGYPLQYFCLENSMDRGAWRSTVYRVAKSWTHLTEQLKKKKEKGKEKKML